MQSMEWNENMPAVHKIAYYKDKELSTFDGKENGKMARYGYDIALQWNSENENNSLEQIYMFQWVSYRFSLHTHHRTSSSSCRRHPPNPIRHPTAKSKGYFYLLFQRPKYLCRLFSSINWLNRYYRSAVFTAVPLAIACARSTWIYFSIFIVVINNYYLHWFSSKKVSFQLNLCSNKQTLLNFWYVSPQSPRTMCLT